MTYLPCAGITLFRFYGYYLSLPALAGKHPEESAVQKSDVKIDQIIFRDIVTFRQPCASHPKVFVWQKPC